MKDEQGDVPPLQHKWEQFVYTDGSHLPDKPDDAPGIGAAIFVPNVGVTYIQCAYQGDEANRGHCNTICRAELAAVDVAIQQTGPEARREDGSLHIATDSLGSMYGIIKAIMRPQDIQEHRHLHILHSIKHAVQNSPSTIHLWKVKSHAGIVGNEIADAAAVSVAKGEDVPDGSTLHSYSTPSNTRNEIYWPHVLKTRQLQDGTETRTTQPIPDLHNALKDTAKGQRKLGTAKCDGVYASSWNVAQHLINHALSHCFLTSTKTSHSARKLALQYRWGLLPTNRWLFKIGKRTDNSCPLCGQEDGGHHAVSACPGVSTAVTKRHNDAGTEIIEAISKGTKGHNLILADVGFSRRRSPQEVPASLQDRRLMKHADFPAYVPDDLQKELQAYKTSIPDAILIEDSPNGYRFTIVEIKYCRDTDPTYQEAQARTQHSDLVDLITRLDPTAMVAVVPLILGVSGAIFNAFVQAMEEHLGVRGVALTSLSRRLHHMAVFNLQNIWRQRMAAIYGLAGQDRRRPRRCGSSHHSRGKARHYTGNSRPKQGQGLNKGTVRWRKRINATDYPEPEHRKRKKKR